VTSSLVEMIAAADRQIRPHVRETMIIPSTALSERAGADVWLKCENLQVTGSFKARGATNRLLAMRQTHSGGVVAASSGNHGVAVAHAGRALGIPVTVYVPGFASPVKVAAMGRLGATVVRFGTDGLDTELEARRFAATHNLVYVSPYNDLTVVAGQGTIGVELRRQLPDIDAIVIAVGGGGLIGGVAADLKHHHPHVRVIGAQPANSRVMAESVRVGRILELPSEPTLSDGTAGGVESDTITFPLCRDLVDEWIEVREQDIARSMRRTIEEEHMLIEGAAAVAVAVVAERRTPLSGRVVVVLCGANVSAEKIRDIL
jgi:threonine dehydratase